MYIQTQDPESQEPRTCNCPLSELWPYQPETVRAGYTSVSDATECDAPRGRPPEPAVSQSELTLPPLRRPNLVKS